MDFIIDDEFRQANRRHTKQERQNLTLILQEEGCLPDALTVGLINGERILVDGHSTFEICKQLQIPMSSPRCLVFSDREAALDWIHRRQRGRRNLSADEMSADRQKRIERVAAARVQGKSTRAIAADEGVSQHTIMDDIVSATEMGFSVSPPDGKVVGSDGRKKPATNSKKKALCTRCARNVRIGKDAVKKCSMCAELRPKKPGTAPKAKDKMVDAFGVAVPTHCRDAYGDPWIQDTIDYLGVLVSTYWQMGLADGLQKRAQHYPFIDVKDFIDGYAGAGHFIDQILEHLKENRPAGVCPSCGGDRCPACMMSGMVPRRLHEELKQKVQNENSPAIPA